MKTDIKETAVEARLRCMYTFYTTGSTDTYGELYTSGQSQVTYNDDGGSGYNFHITYTPPSSGDYYLKVRGYSSTSTSGPYTLYHYYESGNAAPYTPAKPSGVSSGTINTYYSYSTSTTDPNANTIRYIYDWGDGSTTTTGYYNSGTTVASSHQWSSAGTYYVRVKAEDSLGAQSAWSSSQSVSISTNTPPYTPGTPSGPSSVTTGSSNTYTASTTDPQSNTIRYLFDWGDGTSTWTGSYSSGSTAQASKTWNNAGTYSVRVKAEDSQGGQSAWSSSRSVTVSTSSSGGGAQTLYESGFEGGTSGWSLSGLWHSSTQKSYEGSRSLWYGQANTGNYETGSSNSGTAISPVIALPSGSDPTLTFRSWFETENYPGYDKMWLEIYSSTGTRLTSYAPLDGAQRQWTLESQSLSQFAGQSIRIHFKFDTVDNWANNFEGWFIDDVLVRTSSGNAPSANGPTVYTTEYYHTSGSGSAWHVYRNDDGYISGTADNRLAGDIVEKKFRVDKDLHGDASHARLWIYVANTGCSGTSQQYTHLLYVNNSPWAAMDPCRAPFTSSLSWIYVDIPMNYINDGPNAFKIVPNQPSTRGLSFGIDGNSPGVDSYIKDNGVEKPGELIWRLYIQKSYEYDMLYRFLVVEKYDENGARSMQYGMEGFTHYSLDDLDSMYFLVLDNENGQRSRVWQTTTWQQNNDYYESNKYPQTRYWPHYRYDFDDKHNGQGGRKSPETGEYYHWYRVEWGTRAANGATTSGHQVVLVDHVPGAAKTYNQYPDKASRPNSLAPLFDIELSAYWEVDKVKNYGHGGPFNKDGKYPMFGRTSGSHAHDHIGFEVQVFDVSKALSDAAQATSVAENIMSSYFNYQSSVGMPDWLQKQMKVSKGGALTSFLLTALQTGNVAHLMRSEWDTGSGGGTFPWTSNGVHPIIPHPIAGPVMMAVDLIPSLGHAIYSHPNVTDPPQEGQGWRWEWSVE